jgi:hypothetical protein
MHKSRQEILSSLGDSLEKGALLLAKVAEDSCEDDGKKKVNLQELRSMSRGSRKTG